jgi:hypothetical protein
MLKRSQSLRGVFGWVLACLVVLALFTMPRCESQAPDSFRWIDFHSPKDQDVVVWVTRALDGQNWTAIREIGVQYDAALVITSFRANPQSAANDDVFSVWSVSLTDRSAVKSILKGANLRPVGWMLFTAGGLRELGAMYEDCNNCAATTFLTAFYYDLRDHTWGARWMRGGQGAPIWSSNTPPDVTRTQVYAVMADPNGRETLGTWNHLDYGKAKPAEDFVYRYDLDPLNCLERMQSLVGKEAASMKERLCHGQDAVAELSRGQDSILCPAEKRQSWQRKPVTTPPANNQGQSRPPGTRQ